MHLIPVNQIAFSVDHIEQLFDTHESIGVLIYDEHYRREIESYNGAFFPEPPGWSTKSIHLLTSHVKRVTSCPTCKTSAHTAAHCPIRTSYYIPDNSRFFSNRGPARPFSRTFNRSRPRFITSSTTTKKGACAYFNRKRGCLKGNSCSFPHTIKELRL